MKPYLSLLLLFLLTLSQAGAQEGDKSNDSKGSRDRQYRQESLALIREQRYDEAAALLDEALRLFPEDQDLIGLRQSLRDLEQLENPVFGKDPPPVTEQPPYDKIDKPDISVTARDPDKTGSGEKNRNTVGIDIAAKTMTPIGLLDDPFAFLAGGRTALGASADIRYYFPFFRRLIGLGIWYEGYFGTFDGGNITGILFHQGGMNLLLRNFPIESNDIRTEISLELGGGLAFFRAETDNTVYYRPLMQVALYAEDPLLYRLLTYESLKPLVFKGGIRFFYYFVENTNMVRYRIGTALRPGSGKNRWEAGLYFHLEDMDISDWSLSSWGIIFMVGFRF